MLYKIDNKEVEIDSLEMDDAVYNSLMSAIFGSIYEQIRVVRNGNEIKNSKAFTYIKIEHMIKHMQQIMREYDKKWFSCSPYCFNIDDDPGLIIEYIEEKISAAFYETEIRAHS